VNGSGGTRKTIITPSAAAKKKISSFVVDENLSLVEYVLAVKLNNSNFPACVNKEEELSLRSLQISNDHQEIGIDSVVLEI
jgi:hypothetical protein